MTTDLLLSAIADPGSDELKVADAVDRLGPGHEPASFWRDLAADDRYPPARRARAVLYMLARHARPGMTLGQLADLLDRPPWLSAGDVDVIPWLVGELPVRWSDEDTFMVMRLFPHGPEPFAVYLRLAGKVDVETAGRALLGEAVPDPVRQTVVVELGFSGSHAPPPVRTDEPAAG